jgi:multidrug efflux pump subunit AcrA (membrane-fusion protein)
LANRLQVSRVETAEISTPLVTVTGVVAACLHPDNGKGADYWQFHSPDLLAAYTDWQMAGDEVTFLEEQLVDIRLLVETQIVAAQKRVERLQHLVSIGTETEADLAEAQAELILAQIEGRKDMHEAQASLRLAQRTETVLARQLEQEGLEPALLATAEGDMDIIIADVPEIWGGRIVAGQSIEARFLSLPGQKFTGTVHAIVPVLSAERRSLRVLISIIDCDTRLRPGMFAEIGIGTDSREALLAPADAVIHTGRADFVLVQENESTWRIVEVNVGETLGNSVEILAGLQDGDPVASRGAILLKSSIIKSLQNVSPQ